MNLYIQLQFDTYLPETCLSQDIVLAASPLASDPTSILRASFISPVVIPFR